MVLGRQEPVSTAHGMDYTVNPIEGLELSDQLHDAVKYIHGTCLLYTSPGVHPVLPQRFSPAQSQGLVAPAPRYAVVPPPHHKADCSYRPDRRPCIERSVFAIDVWAK